MWSGGLNRKGDTIGGMRLVCPIIGRIGAIEMIAVDQDVTGLIEIDVDRKGVVHGVSNDLTAIKVQGVDAFAPNVMHQILAKLDIFAPRASIPPKDRTHRRRPAPCTRISRTHLAVFVDQACVGDVIFLDQDVITAASKSAIVGVMNVVLCDSQMFGLIKAQASVV